MKRTLQAIGGILFAVWLGICLVNYTPADAAGQQQNFSTGSASPNNGTAGAVATYAAAGGSTALGPDQGIISNGVGGFTIGSSAAGAGTLTMVGSSGGAGTTLSCNPATTCATGLTTGKAIQMGTLVINAHINQTATANFAGTCTPAATTTCTITIGASYTSTPICVAAVQSAAPTTFQGSCALSGTTVTITASAANSNLWAAVLIGNPN